MSLVARMVSKVNELPILGRISPSANQVPSQDVLDGFLASQRLAVAAAKEVASFLQPGWTEKRAAKLLNTYLQDHGVREFFHYGFVWFGDRTRFEGVRHYYDYLPTDRVLHEGHPYILDVAPIYRGHVSDIGYSGSMGQNDAVDTAKHFLAELKDVLPKWFEEAGVGSQVWKRVDAHIASAGYDNIHSQYPFSVLGHRVHRVFDTKKPVKFINFGWQSYFSLLSRGLFGQLLNQDHEGDIYGAWAIEPHIGGKGFGAKFEEILIIGPDGARWLENQEENMSL